MKAIDYQKLGDLAEKAAEDYALENRILGFLELNPEKTVREIALPLVVRELDVYECLSSLVAGKKVSKTVREGEVGRYAIASPSAGTEKPVKVRVKPGQIEKLILGAVSDGYRTQSQIRRRLSLENTDISSIVEGMVESGKIQMFDRGTIVAYFLPGPLPKRIWLDGERTEAEWPDREAEDTRKAELIAERSKDLERETVAERSPEPEKYRVGRYQIGFDRENERQDEPADRAEESEERKFLNGLADLVQEFEKGENTAE